MKFEITPSFLLCIALFSFLPTRATLYVYETKNNDSKPYFVREDSSIWILTGVCDSVKDLAGNHNSGVVLYKITQGITEIVWSQKSENENLNATGLTKWHDKIFFSIHSYNSKTLRLVCSSIYCVGSEGVSLFKRSDEVEISDILLSKRGCLFIAGTQARYRKEAEGLNFDKVLIKCDSSGKDIFKKVFEYSLGFGISKSQMYDFKLKFVNDSILAFAASDFLVDSAFNNLVTTRNFNSSIYIVNSETGKHTKLVMGKNIFLDDFIYDTNQKKWLCFFSTIDSTCMPYNWSKIRLNFGRYDSLGNLEKWSSVPESGYLWHPKLGFIGDDIVAVGGINKPGVIAVKAFDTNGVFLKEKLISAGEEFWIWPPISLNINDSDIEFVCRIRKVAETILGQSLFCNFPIQEVVSQ